MGASPPESMPTKVDDGGAGEWGRRTGRREAMGALTVVAFSAWFPGV